jgi:hypothetical protein
MYQMYGLSNRNQAGYSCVCRCVCFWLFVLFSFSVNNCNILATKFILLMYQYREAWTVGLNWNAWP